MVKRVIIKTTGRSARIITVLTATIGYSTCISKHRPAISLKWSAETILVTIDQTINTKRTTSIREEGLDLLMMHLSTQAQLSTKVKICKSR